ncbi:RCC1 domain-containing protein [Vibrio penaeicida]|uniref:hypothetical protein n=1 Tax=Vibrio penaeicida TaxID=104609 RepID=UPI001CC4133D|nr:hypothetical protein [Vibrio penaeicida]
MNIKLITLSIVAATTSLSVNAGFVSVIDGSVGSEANPPESIVIGEIDGGTPPQPDPSGTARYKDIYGVYDGAFAIDINGDLWAIGDNQMGNFGNGSTAKLNDWSKVATGDYVDVAASGGGSILINSTGDLLATGANWGGRLGDGTENDFHTWKVVQSGSFKQVEAGNGEFFAIDSSNNLWAVQSNSWTVIASNVKDISAYDSDNIFYIDTSGELYYRDNYGTWHKGWVSGGEDLVGHYLVKSDGVYEVRNDGTERLAVSGQYDQVVMAAESWRGLKDGDVYFCGRSCTLEESGDFVNLAHEPISDTTLLADDGNDLYVKGHGVFGGSTLTVNNPE